MTGLYMVPTHVLGPLLYMIYTSGAAATVRAMTIAMEDLGTWMSSNWLRLNSLKTKFIWFGTHQQLAKLDKATLAAEFPHFIFSSVVRDLGVILDQELTFAPRLNLLSRACYY